MLTLYRVLVLLLIEYCSSLWSPTELGQYGEVKNVLSSFARSMEGLENFVYWESIHNLKLCSHEQKSERSCFKYVRKIVNDLAPTFNPFIPAEFYASHTVGDACARKIVIDQNLT